MNPSSWKLGWRLWSPRSYTDAVDTRTGDRVVLEIRHPGRGVTMDRFGPNVGQPDPSPPVHPGHRDLPDLHAGLKLGCWTLDGCYELELDRPEVRLRILLADSRSLACGPSDNPVMRQGVLLGRVDCQVIQPGVEVRFRARGAGGARLTAARLDGPCQVQDDSLLIQPGKSAFAIGRMQAEVDTNKALKRIRQMMSYVRHFGTAQLNGPQRMGHAVRWNVCHDAREGGIYLAVSRSWVQMMALNLGLPDYEDAPLIFGWDTALSAILVARSEPALARELLSSVLKRQRPDGRLPAMAFGRDTADRHMPPLLPLAVWYLCHDGDWGYAAEVLPALARAHHRLLATREPRRDGLLSWGNDNPESTLLAIPGWPGAAYESGMDNSPMWEELGFDEQHQVLGRACVDLCSMAALSARVLAAICEHTGEDPEPYQNDYRRIASAVNNRLWGQDELYHNMSLDGSLATRVSPTSFYPMLAGLCPKERAARMIQRHLRSRESFWGHPVVPSVPRDSWLYDGDGDYWRGRIWPPMNYLVWAGLRQYNPGEAAHLAEHSRLLFDTEWERHRHVHENYSAVSGEGEASPGTYARSCKLYCWGGLLLLSELESKVGGAIVRLPPVE